MVCDVMSIMSRRVMVCMSVHLIFMQTVYLEGVTLVLQITKLSVQGQSLSVCTLLLSCM